MNYKEFYGLLRKCNIIAPIWEYVLDLSETFIKDNSDKDNYLILFAIYFSLINDGNICMSLNKDKLLKKWRDKLDGTGILLLSKNEDEKVLDDVKSIKDISTDAINNYLDNINTLSSLVGLDHKMFVIDNGYLYLNKYYVARNGIIDSIKRLFPDKKLNADEKVPQHYNGGEKGFDLSNKQYEAACRGINNNLIITGGPGTGKTTSILFILLNILKKDNDVDYDIKLVAPSGKAASRMKESIINTSNYALSKEEQTLYEKELNKIKEYEGSTIHRALDMNPSTSIFRRNKNNRFPKNTIFIIDEASMIDIELFNYLLEAIDTESKVFIMGDKNQLPSVDVGAVFGDLLNKESYLYNYIVEIDESKRFPKGSEIYNLASDVNEGKKLNIDVSLFKSYENFKVELGELDDGITPIYYYLDNDPTTKEKEIIKHIVDEWYKSFYKDLYHKSIDLDYENADLLNSLFALSEKARILCSQNEGYRGTRYINELVRKNAIHNIKDNKYKYNYPGQLMIVTKNNNRLDLFNGDAGIVVQFKDDDTLYLMVRKTSKLVDVDGKLTDNIFKKGTLYFYPLRMIAKSEIDDAYAITIHKSQGSDYQNILVILPKKQGNPLLNRQILYTGITRTKKRTYILSNIDRLNEAIDNVLVRDTNINI